MIEELPNTPLEQVQMLEKILVAACEGSRGSDGMYQQLRSYLMGDSVLRPLLPDFVRTSRDLSQFWGYIKLYSPKWEPRRQRVRSAMTPIFDHLERANRAPVDMVASEALQKFNAEGIRTVWEKALSRRHTDPEGAITTARALLETVCKHIIEESGGDSLGNDDLPTLYRSVATKLKIAPSQYSEEAFKRILGGATSVVEGLGSLRNKIGDAHGQGRNPVRPAARHAQLAVNLAGAMAIFLVDTWAERNS